VVYTAFSDLADRFRRKRPVEQAVHPVGAIEAPVK
jgi:hypothetical protein